MGGRRQDRLRRCLTAASKLAAPKLAVQREMAFPPQCQVPPMDLLQATENLAAELARGSAMVSAVGSVSVRGVVT